MPAQNTRTPRARLRRSSEGRRARDRTRRAQNGADTRSPKEIAKDRASWLLDLAVAEPGEYSWTTVRPELAQRYTEADMGSIADFVRGPA